MTSPDLATFRRWESRAQAQILVAISGAALDRIRLMKTLFLVWYRGGKGQEGPFLFEPYLYGPCSFEVYRELEKLLNRGTIVQAPHSVPQWSRYHLAASGKEAANKDAALLGTQLATNLQDTAKWAAELSFRELLDAVYSEAPEFATRSVARSDSA